MKKLLTILLVLCTLTSSAQMRGGSQYDPGAARSNLSNVDATATPSMTSITLSDKIRAAWADILGDIYASGTAKVATGTAAAPAYSFGSDPDTGIYSPGANTLGFGVGGAENFRINSSGNILIATSTKDPTSGAKMQISGAITSSGSLGDIPTYAGAVLDYHAPSLGARLMAGNGAYGWGGNVLINPYGGNVLIATSTDDGANKLQVNGFTKLGEAATGIKMKVLTGTTAAAEGGITYITHGLTPSKILSFSVFVMPSVDSAFPPEYQVDAEYQYSILLDTTSIGVKLSATNSGLIVSIPCKVMIWYVE